MSEIKMNIKTKTTKGKNARIICIDRKDGFKPETAKTIIALISETKDTESVRTYNYKGEICIEDGDNDNLIIPGKMIMNKNAGIISSLRKLKFVPLTKVGDEIDKLIVELRLKGDEE